MENDSYENVFRFCEKTLRTRKDLKHNEAVERLAEIVAEADREISDLKILIIGAFFAGALLGFSIGFHI